MDSFESLEFVHPWRPYQKRLLDAVDRHLGDGRIHIVAAPGSGKTTLGIEIARRLNRRTLVLSPTRTIRDQWIGRLAQFTPDGRPPDWAATDMDDGSSDLLSLTYQAILTRHRRDLEDEIEELDDDPAEGDVRTFRDALAARGFGTLVLDEAHHLRQEWWTALQALVRGLEDIVVVSLTATPPYDSRSRQWHRYEELCGPIDEEIAVPELVKTGTLCPHQDYVMAVPPSSTLARQLGEFRARRDARLEELTSAGPFQAAVMTHPWIVNALDHQEPIFENTDLAVDLLAYHRHCGLEEPAVCLDLFDADYDDVPALDRPRVNRLVSHYLYGKSWAPSPDRLEHVKELGPALRSDGMLRGRKVDLYSDASHERLLSLDPAKMDGVCRITGIESTARGADLRQVILTDFIRDDGKEGLGAVPLFARLRAAHVDLNAHTGLITGRLTVLPETCLPELPADLRDEFTPHDDWPGCVVNAGRKLPETVAAVTNLLQQGNLRVLTGTRALLGEGWDAPAINSLVLASFVGSFMMTNQMRGRAIRVDRSRPDKSSSIWHLVAIGKGDPTDAEDPAFSDWRALGERFDTFVGLHQEEPEITNGLDRILPTPPSPDIDGINGHMQSRFAVVNGIGRRWEEAIDNAVNQQMAPAFEAETPDEPFRRHAMFKTLKYLLISALAAFTDTFFYVAGHSSSDSMKGVFIIGLIAASIGLLAALPFLFRWAWLWLRHGNPHRSLASVGLAVHGALTEAGLIEHDRGHRVTTQKTFKGWIAVMLVGAGFRDRSLFADAVDEVLSAPDNPRYLVVRRSPRWFGAADYFSVPKVLATNKELAVLFHARLTAAIGPAELVYTRNKEGRRVLLRARARSFSSRIGDSARRDRWS